MVDKFVGAAQVQGLGVLVLDVEAKHVDPEPAGGAEVGDGELGVGGPDDVGCGGAHETAPKRGVWTSPRATWTIRFVKPDTWGDPDVATAQVTDRYSTVKATAWDRIHPGSPLAAR